MPPKPKFEREEIIAAALDLVSRKGIDALTTRGLGQELGSSARPIFTAFKNMEELQGELREAAMARFESYAEKTKEYTPVFKQVGMQMALFALEEPKLFQLLFMQENQGANSFDDVFGQLGEMAEVCIEAICADYGLTREDAQKLFETVWIYTFGVGVLCATGMCRFTPQQLGDMLTREFTGAMMMVKSSVSK